MIRRFTKITILIFIPCLFSNHLQAQEYWQQRVEYTMSIDFDAKSNQYTGKQILKYYNNSPDTLYKVYYHLYLNAFQPNSMMDVRSRNLPDPDSRVRDRIQHLSDKEIGYLRVNGLEQEGTELSHELSQTILEVDLAKPIPPGSQTNFTMDFEAQVPLQIRRTGRNSYEGVDYSMAQWYPKMAQYDEKGWHTSPYVAREFYAPWGDFEVNITIDRSFILAGTGVIQNPNEVGYGYEDKGVTVKHKTKKLTWKFKAENVHDFVWAADTDYKQITTQVPGGPLLRFFFIPNEETKLWEELPPYTVKAFDFIESHYGDYKWPEYSIIQAGDGGMEYPMATLIANKKLSGVRSWRSLVGVVIHELMHCWYQGMLATDESHFAWMDEGFASYADAHAENYVLDQNKEFPLERTYKSYYQWARTGREEPMTTHADHFSSNYAYSRASYTKGAVLLEQLGYIIGEKNRDEGLLKYHDEWAFKHPDVFDFIRVMENVADIELSWYFEYWVNTTHTIDYSIDEVKADHKETLITLARVDPMPMPIDLVITQKNGDKITYYIPLAMMLGEKPNESSWERMVEEDWPWTHPTYTLSVDIPFEEIESVAIDPSGRMADINQSNNTFTSEANENTSGNDTSKSD